MHYYFQECIIVCMVYQESNSLRFCDHLKKTIIFKRNVEY